ncbi:MAG: AI-2E family transporter [Clostridia bacterium]|nr:AI-2E family transporter [Clostridia bacterium]
MKLNNTKYNTYAAYALIIISFGLLYAAFIFNLSSVFAGIAWFLGKIKCVFYAILFTFISVPPMRFFERLLTRHVFKTQRRLPLARVFAVILAELLLLAVLFLFVFSIIPSLSKSFTELQADLSPAVAASREWIETNVKDSEILLPIYESLVGYLSDAFSPTGEQSLTAFAARYVSNIASETSAIFLGFVLSAYCLLFRRVITSITSKILVSRLPGRVTTRFYAGAKRTYLYFMEYLSVKVVSSIFLSLLTYLLCLIFGIPFRALITILVFAFDMMPDFGMILLVVLLPVVMTVLNRPHALPLFLILFFLHLLYCILAEPFFLRKRLRPNIGLTICLSLFFGGLFGFFGFLFAVPLFASLHALIENAETRRLLEKGRPTNDEFYLNLRELPEPPEPEPEPEAT